MITFISLVCVIAGAINWFLIGAFSYDLLANIFGGFNNAGTGNFITLRIVYAIIGLMSIWLIYVMASRRDIINFKNDMNFKNKKKD